MQVQEEKPYDEINITPMLDLSYVLLVIFIIMCTASVQGVKVKLPNAKEVKGSPIKPDTKAITVSADGQIYWDAIPVSLEQLGQDVRDEQARNPKLMITLRGDSVAQYQTIMDIYQVLTRNNMGNLGIAFDKKKN